MVHAAGSVKQLVTEACWDRGVVVSSAVAQQPDRRRAHRALGRRNSSVRAQRSDPAARAAAAKPAPGRSA
ncbi:hypothetical protein [Streptomyces sp. NPDC002044]|uniref:hypothetical protein n=1 Tax=Streptomyces sp. NPDC002044 TaxID=3154662 RepID=UPI00331D550B